VCQEAGLWHGNVYHLACRKVDERQGKCHMARQSAPDDSGNSWRIQLAYALRVL
jgi:hypothetical protein